MCLLSRLYYIWILTLGDSFLSGFHNAFTNTDPVHVGGGEGVVTQ